MSIRWQRTISFLMTNFFLLGFCNTGFAVSPFGNEQDNKKNEKKIKLVVLGEIEDWNVTFLSLLHSRYAYVPEGREQNQRSGSIQIENLTIDYLNMLPVERTFQLTEESLNQFFTQGSSVHVVFLGDRNHVEKYLDELKRIERILKNLFSSSRISSYEVHFITRNPCLGDRLREGRAIKKLLKMFSWSSVNTAIFCAGQLGSLPRIYLNIEGGGPANWEEFERESLTIFRFRNRIFSRFVGNEIQHTNIEIFMNLIASQDWEGIRNLFNWSPFLWSPNNHAAMVMPREHQTIYSFLLSLYRNRNLLGIRVPRGVVYMIISFLFRFHS